MRSASVRHPDDASFFCRLTDTLELSVFHALEDVWIVAGDAGCEVVGVAATIKAVDIVKCFTVPSTAQLSRFASCE